jgi:DNA-binding XRE family transcriptional regulator
MSRPAQQPSPNLAALRMRAHLTPATLAKRAGVATRTIHYAERGSIPHLATQIKIATALRRALRTDSPTYPRPLTHLDLWPPANDDRIAA